MSSEKTNIFGQQLSKRVPNKERTAFAEKIGVTYEAVRIWCEGKSLPNAAQLIKMREILDVSIDWLLTGKQPVATNPSMTFMDAAEEYPLLKSIVPRANRALRQGRSPLTVAKIIKKVAEVEIIDLEDALKNKEKQQEDEHDDE